MLGKQTPDQVLASVVAKIIPTDAWLPPNRDQAQEQLYACLSGKLQEPLSNAGELQFLSQKSDKNNTENITFCNQIKQQIEISEMSVKLTLTVEYFISKVSKKKDSLTIRFHFSPQCLKMFSQEANSSKIGSESIFSSKPSEKRSRSERIKF